MSVIKFTKILGVEGKYEGKVLAEQATFLNTSQNFFPIFLKRRIIPNKPYFSLRSLQQLISFCKCSSIFYIRDSCPNERHSTKE